MQGVPIKTIYFGIQGAPQKVSCRDSGALCQIYIPNYIGDSIFDKYRYKGMCIPEMKSQGHVVWVRGAWNDTLPKNENFNYLILHSKLYTCYVQHK